MGPTKVSPQHMGTDFLGRMSKGLKVIDPHFRNYFTREYSYVYVYKVKFESH